MTKLVWTSNDLYLFLIYFKNHFEVYKITNNLIFKWYIIQEEIKNLILNTINRISIFN